MNKPVKRYRLSRHKCAIHLSVNDGPVHWLWSARKWFIASSLSRRVCSLACVLCIGLASATAGQAAYWSAKSVLAQRLIAHAWQRTLTQAGLPHRPWPWADTRPIARLIIPSVDVDTWVLNGSDGTTLAFAPGMSAGSVAPGQNGVIVIGAHRDTHFRNLQFIAVGDTIRLQDKHRRWHEYRITKTSIADVRTDEIVVRHDRPRLLLVTCYPFDALMPGGPLRYVLDAELV